MNVNALHKWKTLARLTVRLTVATCTLIPQNATARPLLLKVLLLALTIAVSSLDMKISQNASASTHLTQIPAANSPNLLKHTNVNASARLTILSIQRIAVT